MVKRCLGLKNGQFQLMFSVLLFFLFFFVFFLMSLQWTSWLTAMARIMASILYTPFNMQPYVTRAFGSRRWLNSAFLGGKRI